MLANFKTSERVRDAGKEAEENIRYIEQKHALANASNEMIEEEISSLKSITEGQYRVIDRLIEAKKKKDKEQKLSWKPRFLNIVANSRPCWRRSTSSKTRLSVKRKSHVILI
jgi:hypothetical protein